MTEPNGSDWLSLSLIKTNTRMRACVFLNKGSIYIPYAYLLSVLTLAVLME